MSADTTKLLVTVLALLTIACLAIGFTLTSKSNREALARNSFRELVSNTLAWAVLLAFSLALPHLNPPRNIVAEGLNALVVRIMSALMIGHGLWIIVDIARQIPKPPDS